MQAAPPPVPGLLAQGLGVPAPAPARSRAGCPAPLAGRRACDRVKLSQRGRVERAAQLRAPGDPPGVPLDPRHLRRVRRRAVLARVLPCDRAGQPGRRLSRSAWARASAGDGVVDVAQRGQVRSRALSSQSCTARPGPAAFLLALPGALGDVPHDAVHLPRVRRAARSASRSGGGLGACSVMVLRRAENASIAFCVTPAISRPWPSIRGTHATPYRAVTSAPSPRPRSRRRRLVPVRCLESSLRHLPSFGGYHVQHQVVLVQLRVPGPGGVLRERGPHPVPGVLPLAQLGPRLGLAAAVIAGAGVPGLVLQPAPCRSPGAGHDRPHIGPRPAYRRASACPRAGGPARPWPAARRRAGTHLDIDSVMSQNGTACRICARAWARSSASRAPVACGSAPASSAKMSSAVLNCCGFRPSRSRGSVGPHGGHRTASRTLAGRSPPRRRSRASRPRARHRPGGSPPFSAGAR